MGKHLVTILNDDIKLEVEEGGNLLAAIQEAKLALDAPCGGVAVQAGADHEDTREAVAEREHFLRLDLAVGDNAHQGGHEEGYDALHRKEPLDLGAHSDAAKIATDRSKVSAPDGELKEIHQNQLEGNGFDFLHSD